MKINMRNVLKKGVCLVVAAIMTISVVPANDNIRKMFSRNVFAQDDEILTGECGDSATWVFDQETGTLNISGSGKIYGAYKFQNYHVKKLVIHEGITEIGQVMFRDSKYLESVQIPASLLELGDYSFEGCIRLEKVEVNPENPNYCDEDGVVYNKNKTMLVIYPPAREGEIFQIPDEVTDLGDNAFNYVNQLKEIRIPTRLKSLGNEIPFYSATSVVYFFVDSKNDNFSSVDGDLYNKDKTKLIKHAVATKKSSVEIKDGVTEIGDAAFENSVNLTNIIIGTDVKTVGNGVFDGCENLINIIIQNSETVLNHMIYTKQNDNLTIWGYSDSTAQTYANMMKINFGVLEEKEAVSISIAAMPKKTTFVLGDKFNSYGLEIRVNYKDGSSVVRSSGFTVGGFDSSAIGKKTITITYQNAVTSYEIEVVEKSDNIMAKLGEKTKVDIIEKNQLYNLYFIPDVSELYDFYALSNSDTYGAIYDIDGHMIAENFDRGDDDNGNYSVDFYITYPLEEGKTYCFVTKFEMDDELGSFDVVIKLHGSKGPEEMTAPEETTKPGSGEEETSKPSSIEENPTIPDIDENETTKTGENVTKKPNEEATTKHVKPITTKPVEQKTTKSDITKVTTKQDNQVANVTKPARVTLSKPKNVKTKKVKLTWKKVDGVNGYEVMYAVNKKFTRGKKTVTIAKASAKSRTIKKLKRKKTYYFKVRAYKVVNHQKIYGTWSKVKKVKIK